MKDCLFLPGLGRKFFNALWTEEDEPIYSHNDKYMLWFVRQSLEVARVCAFIQYYTSKICDDFSKGRSENLSVKGNFYDIIETYLKKTNKRKFLKKNMKVNSLIIEI